MRLLKAREDAVLWLLAGSGRAQANLREHARSHGVDPGRLVLHPCCRRHATLRALPWLI